MVKVFCNTCASLKEYNDQEISGVFKHYMELLDNDFLWEKITGKHKIPSEEKINTFDRCVEEAKKLNTCSCLRKTFYPQDGLRWVNDSRDSIIIVFNTYYF